jgi:hypothetical protein
VRRAAVATAAAAALIAGAPDASLANAFDGDLSPTNGPLKSLPKGTPRGPETERVPFRENASSRRGSKILSTLVPFRRPSF